VVEAPSHLQQLSLRERAVEVGPSLSPVLQRIVDHLLGAGPEVVLLSAAELAAEIGTSDASIIRTAKALGYAGLDELRRAISAAGRDPSLEERLRHSLAEGVTDESILDALIRHHLASLDALARGVGPELLHRAVVVLAEAARIVWCGTGPSAAVAEYGAILASRLGRPSTSAGGSGTRLADELLAIGPGDVVVIFSYGHANDRPRPVVERCEELAVPTVLITDSAPRWLRDRVTTVLPCGRGAPDYFSSHAATLVLIEALVLNLAALDPRRAEASLAVLNDLRASVAGRRRDVYRA
jgi:DNA-binding MurR/RpiR family transcriptional regulator